MSTIINNNKVITQTWGDYNSISEGIMSQINYKDTYLKVSHVLTTMALINAKEYSIELDIADVELIQYEDTIDLGFYMIMEDDSIQLYIHSSTLDVQHKCNTHKESLYEDIRDLVTRVLQDPINQNI